MGIALDRSRVASLETTPVSNGEPINVSTFDRDRVGVEHAPGGVVLLNHDVGVGAGPVERNVERRASRRVGDEV